MTCEIVWSKPSPLEKSTNGRIYDVDLDDVSDDQGVYVFYRSYDQTDEVLYVGKALGLRGRIKTQLNNLKLMKAIEDAPKGSRYLACGYLKNKKGATDRLVTIERALIKHFVAPGHGLVNIQSVGIHKDLAHSVKRPNLAHLIPAKLYFEAK